MVNPVACMYMYVYVCMYFFEALQKNDVFVHISHG